MNLKTLIPIISIVSVLVMFLLNAAGVAQSWLAVFAGGVVITVISIISSNKKKEEKADTEKESN